MGQAKKQQFAAKKGHFIKALKFSFSSKGFLDEKQEWKKLESSRANSRPEMLYFQGIRIKDLIGQEPCSLSSLILDSVGHSIKI